MAAVADTHAYPRAVVDEFERLKQECADLLPVRHLHLELPERSRAVPRPATHGPAHPRGEVEAVLKSDDLWRCTECGTCTTVCRMEIDVAGVLHGCAGSSASTAASTAPSAPPPTSRRRT